jgi:hypothetical protein
LITVILGINFIQASPAPGKVSKSALKDPIAMQELETWVDIFGLVGLEKTPKEIAELTVSLADNWKAGKRFINRPMRPFWKITATQQGWGLFTYPDTHPYRMEISIRDTGKSYRPIFVSQDPDLDFGRSVLTFRRVRGLYNPGRRAPKTYANLTRWFARKVFAAYPEATRVKFRFYRTHTTLPGAPVDREETIRFSRTLKRGEVE